MSDFNGYRFRAFALDLDRAELRSGGNPVELRPQSFDVLRVLVENAGRLVTRDELHDAVWGNIAVTDDSIAHCVSDIRKALGDSDRQMLQTVPRRGYRFNEAVTAVHAGDAATESGRGRRQLLIAVGLAVVAIAAVIFLQQQQRVERSIPPTSIAVLPFVSHSGDAPASDEEFPGTSLSTLLRDQLGRVRGLQLAARSSSVAVQKRELDAVAAANVLGVAHVVEGSVIQQGTRLRVSVQLLDGRTGLSVWAETFERPKSELIAIQDEMTSAIVSRILPGAEDEARSATRSASANRLMLRAVALEHAVRDEPAVDVPKLLEAVDFYRQATEADPESAIAHSRLAGALLYLEDVQGADAPIRRALMLDPELAEVQLTLGEYLWRRRIEGYEEAWTRALELAPTNPDALARYAFVQWLKGNSDTPADYYRQALRYDPLSLERYWELGNFIGIHGRVREVRELLADVQRVFADDLPIELVARLHEFLGEVDHAIAWTLRARDRDPGDPSHNWRLAELFAIIGEHDVARRFDSEPGPGVLFLMRRYDELIDVGEDLYFGGNDDIMSVYLLAFAYNTRQRYAEAERILRLSGLVEAIQGWPQGIEVEAWVTYVNALHALGRKDEAAAFATRFVERPHVEQDDWWVHIYRGCMYALIGRRDEAIEDIRAIHRSSRIPWVPVLQDSPCFDALDSHPVFVGVVEETEARRAALRERWPETLEDYGVELQILTVSRDRR